MCGFLTLGEVIISAEKKEYFSELDENFSNSVKLGINSNMVVNGKGNIRIDVNGVISIISGVFYVPELKNNLFSKDNAKYIIQTKV